MSTLDARVSELEKGMTTIAEMVQKHEEEMAEILEKVVEAKQNAQSEMKSAAEMLKKVLDMSEKIGQRYAAAAAETAQKESAKILEDAARELAEFKQALKTNLGDKIRATCKKRLEEIEKRCGTGLFDYAVFFVVAVAVVGVSYFLRSFFHH